MKIPLYRGQALILVLVFFGAFLAMDAAIIQYVASRAHTAYVEEAVVSARTLAEGGVDAAITGLNGNSSYSGETITTSNGVLIIYIQVIDESTRRVQAIASVPSLTQPLAEKTVRATLVGTTTEELTTTWSFVPGSYLLSD